MISNFCTACPPQKNWGGGEIFPTPLKSEAWSKLFLAIIPEKEYPKLVLKFWGFPKKFAGVVVKISPNFMIFRLFHPFLQNGARYHQSENGLLNYRHSSTRRKKRYTSVHHEFTWLKLENTHPPIWLPVFIQSDSPEGAVGGNIPIRRSNVEIISSWFNYCNTLIHNVGSLFCLLIY